MAREVVIETREELDRFVARLENETRVPLDIMGGRLATSSQKAFTDQQFGDFSWPARYFGKGDPFVNVAGAIEDLTTGARIKSRRFETRPALTDTGTLFKSITHEVKSGTEVQVGSPLEYAADHQHGKSRSMPVTQTVKDNLAKWLKKGDRVVGKSVTGKTTQFDPESAFGKITGVKGDRDRSIGFATSAIFGGGNPFRSRLGFLFNLDTYDFEIIRRPFIGVTDEAEKDVVAELEAWAAGDFDG